MVFFFLAWVYLNTFFNNKLNINYKHISLSISTQTELFKFNSIIKMHMV